MNKITVNWHLWKSCNYKCKFCFAGFEKVKTNLDLEDGKRLIKILKENHVYKVNFAGGEPLLNKHTGDYIKYAKEIGLKTSIISNGSLMTKTWLNNYGEYLDQIGISCDSIDNEVNRKIGRGFGNHVDITKRALTRINEMGIKTKLNTVVLRDNYLEDWNDFINEFKIDRWKVFKILRIEGENDHVYDDISITDLQYHSFLVRHHELSRKGILIDEDNNDMTNSYIMITPDGRFYQNTSGKYIYSKNILTHGFSVISETGFNVMKYIERGGSYSV